MIDQDIWRTQLAMNQGERTFHPFRIGDVCRHRESLAAHGAYLAR